MAQQPTPHEQALGNQIMACIGETISVREQLVAAQAEIARLKEPAKETPKP
jgi:hypothetical protein